MITAVRLSNFKCFQNQVVPLRPLTILAGINGSGKSSVIQSLLLLRQSFQQGLLPNYGLALNGALVALGTARDVLWRSADDEKIGIEVIEGERRRAWSFRYDSTADVLGLSDKPEVLPDEDENVGIDFQYLSAERVGPRASFAMADYEVRHQRQVGSRGEYTAHFLAVYGAIPIESDMVCLDVASSHTLASQVEAWLGVVSPGVRLNVVLHPSMDIVNVQFLFVEGRLLSDPFRPTNVGFGLTYTLPVIVALLGAKPGSLLVVENPEAHLHARGQVKLAELLCRVAESGVQVVVETHSEHILNGVRLGVKSRRIKSESVQVNYFEREVHGDAALHRVIHPQIDQDGRIDIWPSGFFDEWDRSLEGLLE